MQLDDVGNLAPFSSTPGSALRPFNKDGARAVAALCSQVSGRACMCMHVCGYVGVLVCVCAHKYMCVYVCMCA